MIGAMVKAAHTAKLEEQMADEAAKILRDEIDWEVMCGMLKMSGWVGIDIKWPTRISESDAHKIKEWCRANLTGHYKGRGKNWVFELEKDAVLFSLRWS